MRAIWKGAVSFGLVNVPVRLYSATENHDVQFRQVHREDGGRIKYKRTCSIDGEEVSYDDIAKGYETEDGDMVVLTDEDFADLPSKTSKEIGVTKFVPTDQIDPMWLDKSYYLEPDKAATKPYILLRDALEKEKRVAICTVSIRTRMTMAVLRVRDGVIVMQTMLWPDEVRSADFATVTEDQRASKQEMDMAKMLIDQLAGDYEPDEYEDDYAIAVKELVRAKVEGGEVQVSAAEPEESGEVVDLLAALARSVEKAKASRGEAPEPAAAKTGGEEDRHEEDGGQEDHREEDDGEEERAEGQLTCCRRRATRRTTGGPALKRAHRPGRPTHPGRAGHPRVHPDHPAHPTASRTGHPTARRRRSSRSSPTAGGSSSTLDRRRPRTRTPSRCRSPRSSRRSAPGRASR